MNDDTKATVLETVKRYRAERPVDRFALASRAHTTDRETRRAIYALRMEGEPICATKDGSGYWYGTRKEYEATTIADYKARIASMAEVVRAFYGLPIEGQEEIHVLL